MITSQSKVHPMEALQAIMDMSQVLAIQEQVRHVHLDEAVADYLVTISRKTREHQAVFLGASPRATLSLVLASKSFAFLHGRDYVIPDDIKYLLLMFLVIE